MFLLTYIMYVDQQKTTCLPLKNLLLSVFYCFLSKFKLFQCGVTESAAVCVQGNYVSEANQC